MHVCAPCACSVQKRAPDLLRLELEMILSNHVGAGNQTWVLCKSYKVLNNSASSPVLALELFTKLEIYQLYCLVIILKLLTLQGKGFVWKGYHNSCLMSSSRFHRSLSQNGQIRSVSLASYLSHLTLCPHFI